MCAKIGSGQGGGPTCAENRNEEEEEEEEEVEEGEEAAWYFSQKFSSGSLSTSIRTIRFVWLEPPKQIRSEDLPIKQAEAQRPGISDCFQEWLRGLPSTSDIM